MKIVQATERIAPAKLPMSLDVGRLTARDGFQLFGLAVSALAAGSLGALLAWSAYPAYLSDWNGVRFIAVAFGVSVALLGVGLAGLTAWFGVLDCVTYQQRLGEYHRLYIKSHSSAGGLEIERSVTGFELTATNPLHVLAAALVAHKGNLDGKSAHSVRSLEGPVFLGGVRLGDISPTEAEAISKKFADLGLVEGRAPRQPGRWVPETTEYIVSSLAERWNRTRGV